MPDRRDIAATSFVRGFWPDACPTRRAILEPSAETRSPPGERADARGSAGRVGRARTRSRRGAAIPDRDVRGVEGHQPIAEFPAACARRHCRDLASIVRHGDIDSLDAPRWKVSADSRDHVRGKIKLSRISARPSAHPRSARVLHRARRAGKKNRPHSRHSPGSGVWPGADGIGRAPRPVVRAADARRNGGRRHHLVAFARATLHRAPDRSRRNLRRSGGDRDPQRAAVQ